jgi:hypothetical protein
MSFQNIKGRGLGVKQNVKKCGCLMERRQMNKKEKKKNKVAGRRFGESTQEIGGHMNSDSSWIYLTIPMYFYKIPIDTTP